MGKEIKFVSSDKHYTADACIVWCLDDRFSNLLAAFIANEKYEHADLVKIAGGAKDIASPINESAREYILDQVAKSIKLHSPPKIILMVHAECGAYGGSMDQNMYIRELKEAREVIKKRFPELSVELYYADFASLRLI